MSAEQYKSKYVKVSSVRELLVGTVKGSQIRIRISRDLIPDFSMYLDKEIESAVQKLINVIPKKQRGDSKGELKRSSLKIEDLNAVAEQVEDTQEEDVETEEETEEIEEVDEVSGEETEEEG